MATCEVAKLRGEYVAPSLGKVTVGELGPPWLARQQGHMKPSGYRSYESAWRNHVAPRWRDTSVSAVVYSEVQAWVSELATELSASMVTTIYSVLAQILDDAVRDRLIVVNAARGVKLPRRTRKPNVYLTVAQLHSLARESGRYGSLVLLLGTGGLRWGEASALRVSDVDFLRRRVVLHENAVTVGSTTYLGTLKSGKSRTVALAPFVIDELAKTCEGKDRDELIWPSAKGGYLGPPASVRSWLSGAVERCQAAALESRKRETKDHGKATTPVFPRITAHTLRHTAASLAISAGANPKVIQRMLGHASAAMTLDVYADLIDDDLSSVADQLQKSVGFSWVFQSKSTDKQT